MRHDQWFSVILLRFLIVFLRQGIQVFRRYGLHNVYSFFMISLLSGSGWFLSMNHEET
ncbi:hypothetical protein BJ508DRAFT_169293 [Ascobolus immersus RN42]|uniref:Uncharacterized protein n=1 Tax=Ascobolus immersus RN42 TaxID=1160509 RepID=A0A3N4I0C4_ASCIM|nr:hypothetical protein BJ508DRAFT_169293 [Ascobolus immersus RN42]